MTVYMRFLNKLGRSVNPDPIPQEYVDMSYACLADIQTLRDSAYPLRSEYWWVDVVIQAGILKRSRANRGEMWLPRSIDYAPAVVKIFTHDLSLYENTLTLAHEWGHLRNRIRYGVFHNPFPYRMDEEYSELYARTKMQHLGYSIQPNKYLDDLECMSLYPNNFGNIREVVTRQSFD